MPKPFSLLPKDYVLPAGQVGYLSMPKEDKSIKIVFVAPIILGYSYWTNDNKCIRSPEPFKSTPQIRTTKDQFGNYEKVKHFWLATVYSFEEQAVRYLEITQVGVQRKIAKEVEEGDFDLTDFSTYLRISCSKNKAQITYDVTMLPLRENQRDWIATLEEDELYKADIASTYYVSEEEWAKLLELEAANPSKAESNASTVGEDVTPADKAKKSRAAAMM